MHGSKINVVPGNREKTSMEAKKASIDKYYASHNWSPFFLQGVKTIIYELWEQLSDNVPDNIIIPAGHGSLVLGCGLGLRDLKKAKLIDYLPRIFVIQAKNCAPLYYAYKENLKEPKLTKKRNTIAEGISSANPIRGREVLRIVRESKGKVIAVSEEEIWEGLKMAAQKGLYIEPTSATAIAGLNELIKHKEINSDERTVVVLTGIGLKATDKINLIAKKYL